MSAVYDYQSVRVFHETRDRSCGGISVNSRVLDPAFI